MITLRQVKDLTKKFQINETTIFREYLQLSFLNVLYSFNSSNNIFFKGGTAIHLIFKAPRFSEDLDFTVQAKESDFQSDITKVFDKIISLEEVTVKEKKVITGKSFLLTAKPTILPYRVYVKLDFSFREKVLLPEKSIIASSYPVLFSDYLHHLSKEEIFAEKIRAILTRKKGRDLYDLWYLLNIGTKLSNEMVLEKLKYYNLMNFSKKSVLERINNFSEKEFILDLRPFISINEREKLPNLFRYIKKYLEEKL